MNTIIDDTRPIQSARAESSEIGFRVGFPKQNPVTSIEPYPEMTDMGFVAWLGVWKGDQLVARLNGAKMAEIRYE